MFNSELEKYCENGNFSFDFSKSYKDVCNAPKNKSGVYLIYKIENDLETLIYIGSSGQRNKDGDLKIRIGGIHSRLIKGYHPNRFGEIKRIQRCLAFPKQMEKEKIQKIKIYWWVTHNEDFTDFPTDVETILNAKYLSINKKLPSWHQIKGSL